MIKALTRRCLGGADPTAPEVRQRCGTLAGGVGILLNTLLCLGKLGAGLLTGSIAVVADGLNNLSDAASSVITLIGFRLAGQAADEEHPFGHGRIEYLSGLLVAMAILLMGFELGKSSLEKLLHPEQLSFSWLAIAILAVSIGMKIWMFHFNRVLGEAISSQAMKATAADSLSDAVATAVVLAHNHPSGIATPSQEDIFITHYIRDALQPLGITLYDHVIMTDDDMVSLKDSRHLNSF